jgi:hypothetical protein
MNNKLMLRCFFIGLIAITVSGCQQYIPDYGKTIRHKDTSGNFDIGIQSNLTYRLNLGGKERRTEYQLFPLDNKDRSGKKFVFMYECKYNSVLYDVIKFPKNGGTIDGGNIDGHYCSKIPTKYYHFTSKSEKGDKNIISYYIKEYKKQKRKDEFLQAKKSITQYNWKWFTADRYAADRRREAQRNNQAEKQRNAEEWANYRGNMKAIQGVTNSIRTQTSSDRNYRSESDYSRGKDDKSSSAPASNFNSVVEFSGSLCSSKSSACVFNECRGDNPVAASQEASCIQSCYARFSCDESEHQGSEGSKAIKN